MSIYMVGGISQWRLKLTGVKGEWEGQGEATEHGWRKTGRHVRDDEKREGRNGEVTPFITNSVSKYPAMNIEN